MQQKLISFDLQADFGVLKKPDVNEGLQMTFNMLHKPALLGILGAIAGLEGYKEKGQFPEYYLALKNVPIGIEPLEGWHEKGSFSKTIIKYTNTIGYANRDGNLIITEQTLIKPAYRCYLLLDLDNVIQETIYNRILAGEAEYVPYLGKNEFSAWWEMESVNTYDFEIKRPTELYTVSTIFTKEGWTIADNSEEVEDDFDFLEISLKPETFLFFERLPIGFNELLFQYELAEFTYTNFFLKPTVAPKNIYYLSSTNTYVQLL